MAYVLAVVVVFVDAARFKSSAMVFPRVVCRFVVAVSMCRMVRKKTGMVNGGAVCADPRMAKFYFQRMDFFMPHFSACVVLRAGRNLRRAQQNVS